MSMNTNFSSIGIETSTMPTVASASNPYTNPFQTIQHQKTLYQAPLQSAMKQYAQNPELQTFVHLMLTQPGLQKAVDSYISTHPELAIPDPSVQSGPPAAPVVKAQSGLQPPTAPPPEEAGLMALINRFRPVKRLQKDLHLSIADFQKKYLTKGALNLGIGSAMSVAGVLLMGRFKGWKAVIPMAMQVIGGMAAVFGFSNNYGLAMSRREDTQIGRILRGAALLGVFLAMKGGSSFVKVPQRIFGFAKEALPWATAIEQVKDLALVSISLIGLTDFFSFIPNQQSIYLKSLMSTANENTKDSSAAQAVNDTASVSTTPQWLKQLNPFKRLNT